MGEVKRIDVDHTVNAVYTHKVLETVDEYINHNVQDIKELSEPGKFKLMLKYIFKNVFKIGPNDIKYNNKNSNIDYSDVDMLNDVWDIYAGLCYEYNIKPTKYNFYLMSGITEDTIYAWASGETRASTPHSQLIKKITAECESALVDGVVNKGEVMSYAMLKAKYGYRETENIPAPERNVGQKTLEQIREERGILEDNNADETDQVPELPDVDF